MMVCQHMKVCVCVSCTYFPMLSVMTYDIHISEGNVSFFDVMLFVLVRLCWCLLYASVCRHTLRRLKHAYMCVFGGVHAV